MLINFFNWNQGNNSFAINSVDDNYKLLETLSLPSAEDFEIEYSNCDKVTVWKSSIGDYSMTYHYPDISLNIVSLSSHKRVFTISAKQFKTYLK